MPDAPDPARSYERARPEEEAGMGRLDNNKAVPIDRPDRSDQAVPNHRTRVWLASPLFRHRAPAASGGRRRCQSVRP